MTGRVVMVIVFKATVHIWKLIFPPTFQQNI